MTTQWMKSTVLLLASGFAGCASTGRMAVGASADADEKAAILNAIDRFFIAMAEGDAAAFATLQTSDGMTYSQRFADGQWTLRRRTNQELLQTLTDREQAVSETYWSPTVLIRGPMAVVWAPYEFRVEGEVSHCGVDAFNMLKIDGEWALSNAMWTAEPQACYELRPPSGATVRPASLASP